MAEKKESSVLFSLRELRILEDERVKTEADAAAAKEAAEKKAREDAERKAREDAEALRAAEEARVRADQDRKESAEREERIRIAESERRAQVEAQMQLEQQRLHLDHQVKLASAPKRSHKLLYGIIAGMVVLVTVLAVVFIMQKRKSDREARAAKLYLAELNTKLADATAESDRINKRIGELTDQLLAASSEADRKRIQDELDAERRKSQENKAKTERIKEGIKSGGKKKQPGIDLNVNTTDSLGGVKGN